MEFLFFGILIFDFLKMNVMLINWLTLYAWTTVCVPNNVQLYRKIQWISLEQYELNECELLGLLLPLNLISDIIFRAYYFFLSTDTIKI